MMTQKTFLSAIIACTWLAGCENLPTRDSAPTALEAQPAAEQKANVRGRTDRALLADVVYSVLAGDIASQRGEYQEAYKQYLYAARLGRDARLAELSTKAALVAHDQAAAQKAVDFWMEMSPDHLGAIQIAALLAAQQGEMDKAVAHMRQLVRINYEQGEDGYLVVAKFLAKINDTEMRLKLMRALVAGQDDNPQALFALALVETGSRRFADAEILTRLALTYRPDWNQARVLLVRVLAAQEKHAEARKALERFLRDTPDDVQLRAVYARLLVEQEDLDEARVQFLRLLKSRPKDPDTLFALGVIALQKGRHREAEGYLRTLYETGKHRSEAAYYLGQILEESGDPDAALGWYAKVEGENLFEARVRTAHLYAKRGEMKRARELIQRLRTHVGKDASQLPLIESEILREAKQYHAAVEVLDKALIEFPDDHDLLYARALTAVHIDRIDILERDLKAILKEDPKHADALNALGYTLADHTDRTQEALGYIQQALELKPDSAAIMDSMGWVHYRLGDNQTALNYLWRAMRLMPDAEIAAHLGEVLWQEGEHSRAREIWEGALRKEPDSEYLLRVLERYGR